MQCKGELLRKKEETKETKGLRRNEPEITLEIANSGGTLPDLTPQDEIEVMHITLHPWVVAAIIQ